MKTKKYTLQVPTEFQKRRLDQVLADWLPKAMNQPLSKAKIRKLIVAGAVYLNKKRVRIASKELLARAVVDIYVDLEKLNTDSRSQDRPFEMTPEHILFEDEYLIIVNKPPGLPTQPTVDEARENLFAAVKKFLAKRSGRPVTQVYLGLHHRLDRDTSGVILFTKSVEANPGIAEIFSKHELEKNYQALAVAKPNLKFEKSWSVKNYLGKVSSSGKNTRFGAVKGGKFAHTDFRVLRQVGDFYQLEAKIHTGRTHQIRVHLSEAGLPILGDLTYGGLTQYRKIKAPRLMLHAVSLTFTHPINKNKISVESSLPEDFVGCINALLQT